MEIEQEEADEMSSFMLRGVPTGLVARAKAQARSAGTTLEAVLIRYLETYAQHGNPQATGARVVNGRRTAEERQQLAKTAINARWKDHTHNKGKD